MQTGSVHSHITFDEVSKQVHHLRDLILWDIQQGFEKQTQNTEDDSFTNHLMFTKYWFIRVSNVNKKRFCLVLLQDMPCAWAVSLLLKSIWNCRPKDAIASQYEATVWSSYDQVPMDHNRSALPIKTLVEVMEADRVFYRTLEPHCKAEFLSELLKISGGPIVWAVFEKAQAIFDSYRDDQLSNIMASIQVIETQASAPKIDPAPADDKNKKEPRRRMSAGGDSATSKQVPTHDAQKELEANLAQWKSIIKSVKDSQKLEEVEMCFSDGTKQRIWKVNRPKPEVTETVDYFQRLPQNVAKRILNYVPRSQLADCAHVNRYWAYLVEEFKAELAVRLRIDLDIEKLTEIMLRHDFNDQSTMDTFKTMSTTDGFSVPMSHSHQQRYSKYSKHASQKSGPTNVFRRILRDKKVKLPPIRNLKQVSERLDRRGAADENLWDWCKIILERYNRAPKDNTRGWKQEGIMDFGNMHFPCPLMSMNLKLPLKPPLYRDPSSALYPGIGTYMSAVKRDGLLYYCTEDLPRTENEQSSNISLYVARISKWDRDGAFISDNRIHSYSRKKNKQTNINASKTNLSKYVKRGCKRYNLWSRDFSSLYTALKIPNYKSPV